MCTSPVNAPNLTFFEDCVLVGGWLTVFSSFSAVKEELPDNEQERGGNDEAEMVGGESLKPHFHFWNKESLEEHSVRPLQGLGSELRSRY